MSVKNSLIAIGVLSACFLQGMKSPAPPTMAQPAEARKPQQSPPLRIFFSPPSQKLVSRQLQSGIVHVYPLPLKAGERVEIIAYQDGVDLHAALFDPSGQHLFTVDNPTGSTGPERILLVAEVSGSYRIDIFCGGPCAPGTYRIWINDEGPAIAKDEQDAKAERLFYQAAEEQRHPGSGSAEDKLRKAAQTWGNIRNAGRQADALSRLGDFYYSQSKWSESISEYHQALNLYHELRRAGDEGKSYNDIGTAYMRLSDLDSARESYKQALACGERSKDQSVIAASYQNLGTVFRREGRAAEALAQLDRARITWKGLNAAQEANTLTIMGEVLADSGKWTQAKAKYQQALAVLASGKDAHAKTFVLLAIADLYLKTQEPEQARRYYERTLKIQQRESFLNDMSISLNGLANAYMNQKLPQDAVEPLRKALNISERMNDHRSQARVLTSLGAAYARLHRDKDAQTSYERALKLAADRDPWTAAGATLGLARLEEARGDPIAAQRQAEAAVRYVEKLRTAAGQDFRTSFLGTIQDVYDSLIEILFEESSLRPAAQYDALALRVSEQARSRGLLDSISVSRSTARQKPSTPVAPILSLRDIQSALDPDTLLLEYHLGQKASHLWVVGPSFYRVIKLPPRQQLEKLISKVYGLLSVNRRRNQLAETARVAQELSRSLLGPAAAWLGKMRLLISAPDSLQSVPIGVLPDPALKGYSPESGVWPKPLFVDHEIVIIPSVSVLSAIRERASHRASPKGLLAIFGDAVTSDRDDRLKGVAVGSQDIHRGKGSALPSDDFERLPHTQEEGDAILKEAGRRGVLGAFGFDATRKLVVSGELSTYRNLHFATHGHLQSNDANRSALILSMWDRNGQPLNGSLEAADIYNLDLPADLVVLSACDTGLGESIPGEGLVGLPQAFLGAGATRVIVSLWPVEDLATSTLMKRFYHEYFANALPPSEALRRAQIAMWKASGRNAPFYWGGFEIEGDWQWVRDPR